MLFNILGLIAGPIMISTGIGLLVVLGWIWLVSSGLGVLWWIFAMIMGIFGD